MADKANSPKHFRVDASVMQAVVASLGEQPYNRVHELIQAIQTTSAGPLPGSAKQLPPPAEEKASESE